MNNTKLKEIIIESIKEIYENTRTMTLNPSILDAALDDLLEIESELADFIDLIRKDIENDEENLV